MMATSTKQGSNNLGISGKSINRPYSMRVLAVSEAVLSRMQKYQLTRKAGSILYDGSKAKHEQHRTCWCHRGVASAADSVTVYRNVTGTSARLHGVTTCKSVWTCPVCSYKICAVRQAELAEGMKNWVGQGGYVFLLTLTFPHDRAHQLADLLPAFTKAKALFKNSKTYKRILCKSMRKGSVSSLEVTLGENGWHPHQHDLVFAQPEAFGLTTEHEKGRLSSALIDELKHAWYVALLKAGLCEPAQLSDVLKHGLDVRGGQYAAEYIAKFGKDQKWGMSREVTMHAAKVGTDAKGAHPFALLAWAEAGDGVAVDQFREYADAFEGKRMLSWSRGLKKELTGTEEKTDEQAADDALPEEEKIGRISSVDLAILQSRHLLGEFLGYVAEFCTSSDSGQSDIDAYIELAKQLDRTGSGHIKRKMHMRGFMHVDAELETA